jgi:hypothetical protein
MPRRGYRADCGCRAQCGPYVRLGIRIRARQQQLAAVSARKARATPHFEPSCETNRAPLLGNSAMASSGVIEYTSDVNLLQCHGQWEHLA